MPMKFKIIPERLEHVETLSLKRGRHDENDAIKACIMEAVSYVSGEPWSDEPQCACPVITAFLISWNDGLPSDIDRDRLLKPLIPMIVGTRSTPDVEQRRATMAADWLIRVQAPAWLRIANMVEQATALELLPEITDFAKYPSPMPMLEAVRKDLDSSRTAIWTAAKAIAWSASWSAALNVVRVSARASALNASKDAARVSALDANLNAAKDVSWSVSWDAARDAAWSAARDATMDNALDASLSVTWAAATAASKEAIKPTVEHLQDSATDLVHRLCLI